VGKGKVQVQVCCSSKLLLTDDCGVLMSAFDRFAAALSCRPEYRNSNPSFVYKIHSGCRVLNDDLASNRGIVVDGDGGNI
jgi:hypothetical protein